MSDNFNNESKIKAYRRLVNILGKKEFTLIKMIEMNFWPQDIPTPFERQINETPEEYIERQKLNEEFVAKSSELRKLMNEKAALNRELDQLLREYKGLSDAPIKEIKKNINKKLIKESNERRRVKRAEIERLKAERTKIWEKIKANEIIFIGKGYSSMVSKLENNVPQLKKFNLPIVENSKELAGLLQIEFKTLKFLAYHRDVIKNKRNDHYVRYTIPKRKGGTRKIAAPKPTLKGVQRLILDKILVNVPVSENAHGFIQGRSVITNANSHYKKPKLLINIDLKDFFPTITFERIRGMFISLGYSGQISSILAMLCTYCERREIEVKNETKIVALSRRILPQGAPSSPYITNIICYNMDRKLNKIAQTYGFKYTRYADDMSFSTDKEPKTIKTNRFLGLVKKIIKEEGFTINKEKLKFLKPHRRQEITGIHINNNEMGIPKKWIKRFRAAIHNASKVISSGSDLPKDKVMELKGMASWAKSVNYNHYKPLIDEVEQLLNAKTS
ncbi:MAG: reverse transcriptase family protein [Promethearchaeota archaeon]